MFENCQMATRELADQLHDGVTLEERLLRVAQEQDRRLEQVTSLLEQALHVLKPRAADPQNR